MTTDYEFRFVSDDSDIKEDGDAIIDSLELAADRIRSKLPRLPTTKRELLDYFLQGGNPDMGFLGVIAAKKAGIPVIEVLSELDTLPASTDIVYILGIEGIDDGFYLLPNSNQGV